MYLISGTINIVLFQVRKAMNGFPFNTTTLNSTQKPELGSEPRTQELVSFKLETVAQLVPSLDVKRKMERPFKG